VGPKCIIVKLGHGTDRQTDEQTDELITAIISALTLRSNSVYVETTRPGPICRLQRRLL